MPPTFGAKNPVGYSIASYSVVWVELKMLRSTDILLRGFL
jgi:hypothetical protein